MTKNKNHVSLICTIHWSEKKPDTWDLLYSGAPHCSLLQSQPYIRAIAKLNNYSIRYGVISLNDDVAGVCAILETGLLNNIVHALMIDQGPIWRRGYGSDTEFKAFLKALRTDFPKRFGRKVRFIPFVSNTTEARDHLFEYGFKPMSKPYQSIRINTDQDLKDLRAQLKKKWRNALSKAEKSNVECEWTSGGGNLGWLVENYLEDKARKNYAGPSMKTLMALISEFSRGQNLMIGTAILDGKPIASILIFIHGQSATYQIGYSGKVGREKAAHHLLLWDAILRLKERMVYDFDLGGINDEDAKGVRDFKLGMGGEVYETPGLWS